MSAVGLLTPSGWGNLGDAAIQDAVIAALRRHDGAARAVAFTLNPADTRRRHGIEAEPIGGFSVVPGYRIQLADPVAASAGEGAAVPAASMASPDPLRRAVAGADEWLYRGLCEWRHGRRMRRRLGQLDLVLVSGGGQLDDEWGGPWGHPWNLFRWAVLCRERGVPLRFVGVGLCGLRTAASRFFLRNALHLADAVSFRDAESRRRALRLGLVEEAGICPDLAFALPGLVAPRPAPEADAVALGPMAWCHPGVWSHKDARAHQAYLERLAAFGALLLDRGRRLLLFATDAADEEPVARVAARLAELRPGAASRVEVPPGGGVEPLLDTLARARTVVASRLHGVILAAGLGRCVLPLSYDRKVDVLARDLDLEHFRVGIAGFDPTDLLRRWEILDAQAEERAADLARRAGVYRQALDEHLDRMLRI